LALSFKRIPQESVILLQADTGIGLLPDLTCSEKVVEMSMRVHKCDDLQAKALGRFHDQFRITTWIKYIAVARVSVAKNGAIALQWAYGKAFVNDSHGAIGCFVGVG